MSKTMRVLIVSGLKCPMKSSCHMFLWIGNQSSAQTWSAGCDRKWDPKWHKEGQDERRKRNKRNGIIDLDSVSSSHIILMIRRRHDSCVSFFRSHNFPLQLLKEFLLLEVLFKHSWTDQKKWSFIVRKHHSIQVEKSPDATPAETTPSIPSGFSCASHQSDFY